MSSGFCWQHQPTCSHYVISGPRRGLRCHKPPLKRPSGWGYICLYHTKKLKQLEKLGGIVAVDEFLKKQEMAKKARTSSKYLRRRNPSLKSWYQQPRETPETHIRRLEMELAGRGKDPELGKYISRLRQRYSTKPSYTPLYNYDIYGRPTRKVFERKYGRHKGRRMWTKSQAGRRLRKLGYKSALRPYGSSSGLGDKLLGSIVAASEEEARYIGEQQFGDYSKIKAYRRDRIDHRRNPRINCNLCGFYYDDEGDKYRVCASCYPFQEDWGLVYRDFLKRAELTSNDLVDESHLWDRHDLNQWQWMHKERFWKKPLSYVNIRQMEALNEIADNIGVPLRWKRTRGARSEEKKKRVKLNKEGLEQVLADIGVLDQTASYFGVSVQTIKNRAHRYGVSLPIWTRTCAACKRPIIPSKIWKTLTPTQQVEIENQVGEDPWYTSGICKRCSGLGGRSKSGGRELGQRHGTSKTDS
jgi:hypothetical protein